MRQKRINENIIGPGKKYPTPISLDPAYYEGAIVYGDDGNIFFSNGTEWLKPETELPPDTWQGFVDLDGDSLRSLQFERKTTSDTNSFTGLDGEVTVDSDKNTLVLHDGSTEGGFALVNETSNQTISNKVFDLDDTTIVGLDGDGLEVVSSELRIDDSVVRTFSNQVIDGIKFFQSPVAVNNQSGITTNQSTFNFITQNASDVNLATAGTNISIGSSSGQTVINNDLLVSGDLVVDGDLVTTTEEFIILEQKILSLLTIEDPEPTDGLADGGGIELNGTTLKEFKWKNDTQSWTSSEHIDLAENKVYKIDETEVLSIDTLSSSVVNSSLESVGTIGSGTWEGSVIGTSFGGTGQSNYTNGQLLIGNTTGGTLVKSTLTEGAGVSISNGPGSITIENTDRGSTQNIFKNVADDGGTVQFSASDNDDTIRFEGTGVADVLFDDQTKTVTVNVDETVITLGDGLEEVNDEFVLDATVVRTFGNQTISGVKTFNEVIDGSISGNSATATELATAREINGVEFDGTQNITILAATPQNLNAGDGIDSTGSFNGTVERTFSVDSTVVRTEDAQTIDGVKTFSEAIVADITGNAATASQADQLSTARTINGVSFDGTQNITITSETPELLIFGNGISSTGNFDGSTERTIEVDSNVVVTIDGTQTITGQKTFDVINATKVNSTEINATELNSELITEDGQRVITEQRQINVGDGLTGGGDLSQDRTLAVDNTVVRVSRTINSGDGLTGGGNLTANRTLAVDSSVVRTSREIVAGDGLDGGGTLAENRTFSVDNTVVRDTREVLAGDGLTGGGTLSSNRTFSVDSSVLRTSGGQEVDNSSVNDPIISFRGNTNEGSTNFLQLKPAVAANKASISSAASRFDLLWEMQTGSNSRVVYFVARDGRFNAHFDGEVRSEQNVIAFFSDERLKNLHGRIPNALEKINSLNGYYFTENEKAKELGYNNDKLQVGVSAQEVKKVLPEIIAEAPISSEYMTVQYEKMVPVLIEAIKEMSDEIKSLKNEIHDLKKTNK